MNLIAYLNGLKQGRYQNGDEKLSLLLCKANIKYEANMWIYGGWWLPLLNFHRVQSPSDGNRTEDKRYLINTCNMLVKKRKRKDKLAS